MSERSPDSRSLDVTAFCRERLAKYKLPTHLEFIAALPKSAVGKVLRRELRDMEASKQSAVGSQQLDISNASAADC